MAFKEKRKELLRLDDRSLVDRILAFPDRERLNRDDEGKRRQFPSAEMALRVRRSLEKDPDYKISEKQRFAMADSFARYSSDELKVAGITFAKADPNTLVKTEASKEGVKTVYNMDFHLVPEPDNERDKNAVAVMVDNLEGGRTRIGYVPAGYVAEHPIVHPVSVKGTLTDHSNGHFKTISYVMDMDTEALDKDLNVSTAKDKYTYRMPFALNGDVQPGAAEYLNSQTWSGAGRQDGWAERLNNELEYWGVNGSVTGMKFEFPGGRAGNIIVETDRKLNSEAMQVCGSYLNYSLESGISNDLKRDGYVKCPVNMPAVNTREKHYFSLQAEPELPKGAAYDVPAPMPVESLKAAEGTGTHVWFRAEQDAIREDDVNNGVVVKVADDEVFVMCDIMQGSDELAGKLMHVKTRNVYESEEALRAANTALSDDAFADAVRSIPQENPENTIGK